MRRQWHVLVTRFPCLVPRARHQNPVTSRFAWHIMTLPGSSDLSIFGRVVAPSSLHMFREKEKMRKREKEKREERREKRKEKATWQGIDLFDICDLGDTSPRRRGCLQASKTTLRKNTTRHAGEFWSALIALRWRTLQDQLLPTQERELL